MFSAESMVAFVSPGKQRGDFHRPPSRPSARPIVRWTKQVGGAAQILEGQSHEEPFADHSRFCLPPDFLVIGRAPRLRSNIVGFEVKPVTRQFVDVATASVPCRGYRA